ncbi:MAG TPA: HD domain-containing phosphohydrolase [Terriglobia bacterium]|nr:HD domain-containing phosphohydrolase [Terriglobia bacterium]
MKKGHPWRLRILYLLLLILIGISVLPLWFYGTMMISTNQETLKTQEQVLQTITSQSLALEISLYMDNVNQHLAEFFDSVGPLAAQIPAAKYDQDPRLLSALQRFVSEQSTVIFATVLNDEARGARAGEYDAAGDTFLRKSLEAAFLAAHQGAKYQSNPITIMRSGGNEAVLLIARPLQGNGKFLGMVGAVVTLAPISKRLQETRKMGAGLDAYIVDNSGRLVASNVDGKNAGMDMVAIPIVQKFLAWRGEARATETSAFDLIDGKQTIPMLGTYSPIQNAGWGVIVQKKVSDAYSAAAEMRKETIEWGILVIFLSLGVGIASAKWITSPIDKLSHTARAIAKRDYTQRADVRSRTEEIGELAGNINLMAEDIQHYIGDLTRASEQNRNLFMESIQMIAAAVDAKDPYTKGHSGRVSNYSVILAREMGLPDDEIDKIRISATLHDVGKIGVDDKVLKKPGVLTNDEFEIMKRHTIMGYEIVRQVNQLHEMLPGIRWHHEALNGKGYPDGITGDEIPLMVRIMSVADTFDAITTDRPYQAGKDFPQALQILRKLAGTKYDPIVVDAMHSAYEKGELRKAEARRSSFITIPDAVTPVAPSS